MLYHTVAVSRLSAQIVEVSFEHAECPVGFKLNAIGGLDWVDLPPEYRMATGHQALTGGRFQKALERVEFAETNNGAPIQITACSTGPLWQAINWLTTYNRAAALARDEFWDLEMRSGPVPPNSDYGEDFL